MSDNLLSLAATAADLAALNTHSSPFSLRLQNSQDLPWVEELHARAFGPGRFARTAFRVREILPIDPDLCLIAELDGQRVGSVWMTPITLGKQSGYLLGPLAADSNHQNKGVGRLLVKSVTQLALEKRADGFVLLVGDAPYYAPLGFVPSTPGAIIFPGPVDPKRVLVCRNRLTHASDLNASDLAGNIIG